MLRDQDGDGLGMAPRPGEPESALEPGMAAPRKEPRSEAELAAGKGIASVAINIPDTSYATVPAPQPGSWTYDFDPSGNARASFNGVILQNGSPIGSGGLAGLQVFTASGTYTPTPGMVACLIECVGGGAGGAGVAGVASNTVIGAGGGSGGYSKKFATAAQIGASQTITVGAGGNGGAATGAAGAAGGASSCGALCLANGAPATPGVYGGGQGAIITGAVGDLMAAGAPGTPGGQSTTEIMGGVGGSSHYGGGAPGPIWASSAAGFVASNYGSGGGGASSQTTTGYAGGNGSPGVVIITEYK